MSLNGWHETRRAWIRTLMYPFMHGTWIKAKSNSCSVDMSHRGETAWRVWIILWPLWMSATDRLSTPSLTTSKCLIKPKWFKNDDDKYLRMAVLHGPVARGRLTTSQLVTISSNTPPYCLLRPAAGVKKPQDSAFDMNGWKLFFTDSLPTYRTLMARISRR